MTDFQLLSLLLIGMNAYVGLSTLADEEYLSVVIVASLIHTSVICAALYGLLVICEYLRN